MKKYFIITIYVCVVIFLMPTFVIAQQGNPAGQGNQSSASASLSDPLNLSGAANTPQIIIGKIIKAALGIVGSLALLMFIYGGLLWMTSAGNQEKVDQGKKIIVWATAGLAVIFLSYAIVNFVIKSLVGQ